MIPPTSLGDRPADPWLPAGETDEERESSPLLLVINPKLVFVIFDDDVLVSLRLLVEVHPAINGQPRCQLQLRGAGNLDGSPVQREGHAVLALREVRVRTDGVVSRSGDIGQA